MVTQVCFVPTCLLLDHALQVTDILIRTDLS